MTRMNLGIPTQPHKDAEIGLGLNQKQSLLCIHGHPWLPFPLASFPPLIYWFAAGKLLFLGWATSGSVVA
ncbi:MAG: hypothetical protein NTY19_52305 [Planctomycetota bacterium]|nr:hypothetical protein [Planctomycetota bacterium]